MILFWVVVQLRLLITEGRVFCEDPNATPWLSRGMSCPLNCENVVAVIERLKLLEYAEILNNQEQKSDAAFEMAPAENLNHAVNTTDRPRPSDNDIEPNDIHREIKQMEKRKKKLMYKKFVRNLEGSYGGTYEGFLQRLRKFGRREFDRDFITIITTILNKFAVPQYRFTDEMTVLLLKKTLGNNMDLRYGVFDIAKILRQLNTEIKKMKNQKVDEVSHFGVKLSSKHCLNLHLPGCYCNRGFVEKTGECMPIAQCLTDDWQLKYLKRITLH